MLRHVKTSLVANPCRQNRSETLFAKSSLLLPWAQNLAKLVWNHFKILLDYYYYYYYYYYHYCYCCCYYDYYYFLNYFFLATVQRDDVFSANFTADHKLEVFVDGLPLLNDSVQQNNPSVAKSFNVPWNTKVLAVKGVGQATRGILGYVGNGAVTGTSWKCTPRY